MTALFVRRVTGGPFVAAVKRQEFRYRSVQLRGHHDRHVANGEMHQRPIRKTQERFGGALSLRVRVTVKAVLIDRIIHRLGEVALQF